MIIIYFFFKEINHIKKTYVCLFYPHAPSWVFPSFAHSLLQLLKRKKKIAM